MPEDVPGYMCVCHCRTWGALSWDPADPTQPSPSASQPLPIQGRGRGNRYVLKNSRASRKQKLLTPFKVSGPPLLPPGHSLHRCSRRACGRRHRRGGGGGAGAEVRGRGYMGGMEEGLQEGTGGYVGLRGGTGRGFGDQGAGGLDGSGKGCEG